MDTSEADALSSKIRILCIVSTTQEHVNSAHVQIVNATWGRKCSKILFVLCPSEFHEGYIDICAFRYLNSTLIGEVVFTLYHLYKNNLMKDFDWILKVEDTTYVVMENLRYMLSHRTNQRPSYISFSDSAIDTEYILNRQGLKRLIENGYEKGLCAMGGRNQNLIIRDCVKVST